MLFQINNVDFNYLTPNYRIIRANGGSYIFAGKRWTFLNRLGTALKRQIQKILNCFRSIANKKMLTNKDALMVISNQVINISNKINTNTLKLDDIYDLQDTQQKINALSHCISRKTERIHLNQLHSSVQNFLQESLSVNDSASKIQNAYKAYRKRLKKKIGIKRRSSLQKAFSVAKSFIPHGIQQESQLLKYNAQEAITNAKKRNFRSVAFNLLAPVARNIVTIARTVSPEINAAVKINKLHGSNPRG
jgi:hypothetical protein